jgi:hypothetical protein
MEDQLRIQIEDGEIIYLPDIGFHLMESPDILIPEQREYETEVYPEHDGAYIYPYTVYNPFDYTVKLLYFGNISSLNSAVHEFWDQMFETVVHGGIRRAKKIRIFNDYKGVQIVGYAKSAPGEDTYIKVLGNGTSPDSGWQFDFTLYVANPSECMWTTGSATLTYSIPEATPPIVQITARLGDTLLLLPPGQNGMYLPEGMVFSGWYLNGALVETVTLSSDMTVVGRIEYNESEFFVSPSSMEVEYDDTSAKLFTVICPDNLWTIVYFDSTWSSVSKVSQNRLGVTLSQNNGNIERSQQIQIRWISPSGVTMNRQVNINQLIYTEVTAKLTASINVRGGDTGSNLIGVFVELYASGIMLASGNSGSNGVWTGTWLEEQSHYESFDIFEFIVHESTEYLGGTFIIDPKPSWSDAVESGIWGGNVTVPKKQKMVTIIYSVPDASPAIVQRTYPEGSTVVLPDPSQIGMTLPDYLIFDAWYSAGSKVTQVIANSNMNISGTTLYREDSFYVTPESVEIGWNDTDPRTFHIVCPNNTWSISAQYPEWATVQKVSSTSASVVLKNNAGEQNRSQEVTFSWTSPKGQIMTRVVDAIQLGYVEVLENISLRIELNHPLGTSAMLVPVGFFVDDILVAEGMTNNNGVWTGTWRTSREIYEQASSMEFLSSQNDEFLSGEFPVSPIPSFDVSVDNGIDMGTKVIQPKPIITTLVFSNSDNPQNISGYGDGAIVDIISKMRRCLAKKTADGEVAICYLNNSNSNQYYDGSVAKLTGEEGDVMVYKPEFYYKYESINSDQFSYIISENPGDETWIKSPESLIGTYKSNNVSGRLYSRSGVSPTGSISQDNNSAYAKARGTGYDIIDFEQHCMIALLFYARYGNRNSQAVLGAGNATFATGNGSTNALGNANTVAATTGHASFAGIEGVHGGAYEWVGGATIENGVWTITNPDGTTRGGNATAGTINGWIVEIAAAIGPYFDMIPTAIGGSATTYFADQYQYGTGAGRVLARSYYDTYTNGGVSCTNTSSDGSVSHPYFASRLAFRGIIRESDSIEEFKALLLL